MKPSWINQVGPKSNDMCLMRHTGIHRGEDCVKVLADTGGMHPVVRQPPESPRKLLNTSEELTL